MSSRGKVAFLICLDFFIILLAVALSAILTSTQVNNTSQALLTSAVLILMSHHVIARYYNLYKKAWRYAGIGELIIICKAVTLTVIVAAPVSYVVLQQSTIKLLTVTWLLLLILIGGTRFGWRVVHSYHTKGIDDKKRTLILGAGAAGTMVARQLINNGDAELEPVAFLDDDSKKLHLDILGIPVVGRINEIQETIDRYLIEHIVIAIPTLKRKELDTIFQECIKTGVRTQTIPRLEDLITGKIEVNQFRDVLVEDLLGRDPVELDIEGISEYITGKTVLVTGAGGSIGSEICRQIAKFCPEKVILLGHGENSIYSIKMELEDCYKHTTIKWCPEIADIQDADKMMNVMSKYQPHVVYHAAAHKHVPLMEENPEEAVKNNIIGTINVAKAAGWHHVETFVMISTDKAVNPTSVMGSTKRLAEMMIQNMNGESLTKFVAVRFGNVLGSRGSVIPLFKKQIEKGGPVTVTHPDMVRYFMTIPEASRLVLQAGALARGGEIFVLDMGVPVKIVDLAKNLIQLSGNYIEDIGIEFTGIRPGEKLFEELLKDDEIHKEQVYPNIYIGKSSNNNVLPILRLLNEFTIMSKENLRERLLYLSNSNINSSSELSVLYGKV